MSGEDVTVDVEIYENWLEVAPDGHVNEPPPPIVTGAHHGGHDHNHNHDDDGHSHLSRPELEQKAVSEEAAPCIGEQVNDPDLGWRTNLFASKVFDKSKAPT